MLVHTVYAPQPSYTTEAMVYRQETPVWPGKAWSRVYPDTRYAAGSALTTSGQNVLVWNTPPSEARSDEAWMDYQPKTALGKKLLELRRAYLASGGKLLSADALDEEMRERRGGINDV